MVANEDLYLSPLRGRVADQHASHPNLIE